MNDPLFDFENAANGKRSLKRIAQAMLRAGQPVVSSELDAKVRRTAGVSYRTALLTLASGQTITLMVKLTGDVFQVRLNGATLPIKNQEGLKSIAEIAKAAEGNQKRFQAAQARKKVEIPKSLRTAAPTLAVKIAERNAQLDSEIAEKTQERDILLKELGEQALDDAAPPAEADSIQQEDESLDSVDAHALTPAAIDQLLRMPEDGAAIDDDKVADPAARDELITAGLLERDDHANWLNDKGKLAYDAHNKAPADQVLDGTKEWSDEHQAALDLAITLAAGDTLDAATDLTAAISNLRIALDVVETNHPINLAAGKLDQAELEASNAESLRAAIGILEAQQLDAANAQDDDAGRQNPAAEPEANATA